MTIANRRRLSAWQPQDNIPELAAAPLSAFHVKNMACTLPAPVVIRQQPLSLLHTHFHTRSPLPRCPFVARHATDANNLSMPAMESRTTLNGPRVAVAYEKARRCGRPMPVQ